MTHGSGDVEARSAADSAADQAPGLAAVTFVDNAGITRAKSVPYAHLENCATAGIGASTTFAVFQGDDQLAQSQGLETPTGDIRLIPSLDALRLPGGGWAWAPARIADQEGEPWPLCTRSFLERMIARAAELDIDVRAGSELEFMTEDRNGHAGHDGPGYGLAALGAQAEYLVGLEDDLRRAGVGLDQLHAEYSPGQYETALSPRDGVTAADDVVIARHVVRMTGRRFGLRTSFSPRASEASLGSGCHVHFSPWRDGTNQFGGDGEDPIGITSTGRSFLAGVVEQLPGLLAIACGSPVSYLRIGPNRWTGAHRCWGVENREAPLRFILGTRASRPGAANAELKLPDASGNPYLVLGAIIAAGLEGVQRRAELSEPLAENPSDLPADELRERDIELLPATMDAAAEALERSDVLRGALGGALHAAIVAVRRGEAATTGHLDESQLYEMYRWRY